MPYVLLRRRVVRRATGNHVIRMSFNSDRDAASSSIMVLVRWVVADDVTLTYVLNDTVIDLRRL